MQRSTMYLRTPEKARKAPKGAWDELSRAAFRYRVQFIPYLIAFLIYVATVATGPRWPWIAPSVLMALATSVLTLGDRIELPRYHVAQTERIYVACVLGAFSLWSAAAIIWSEDGKPNLRFLAALILGTTAISIPWFWRRRVQGSVRVTFEPIPTIANWKYRRAYRKWHRSSVTRAKEIIEQWDGTVRGTRAVGSKVVSVHFDFWSFECRVRLAHAKTAEDFTELQLRRLESAFGADRGSARVDYEAKGKSRMALIKFMLRDPHADAIIPLDDDLTGDSELTMDIGRFEDNTHVIIQFIHTLIAGASGAGKSGVINAIMRALARKRNVAIVGVDLKPGALELGPWEPVMYALAKTGPEATQLLDEIIRGITRRGEIMRSRGIRKWVPTEEEPFVVMIIDEVQMMKEFRLFAKLVKVSELSRAYGFALIMATQHPKDKSVPTEAIANCEQRIGLKTNASTAERLIFDDNATKEGWRLTNLQGDREGSFLVKSKKYTRPKLARAYMLDDLRVQREAALASSTRTMIDSATWDGDRYAIDAPDEDDTVETAVIIEDQPEDLVLMAIAAGAGTPSKISDALEMPRSSVIAIIRRLADQRRIVQDGPRKPWRVNRT